MKLVIDYNKIKFSILSIGEYFIHCYDIDLINQFIEDNRKLEGNKQVPFILGLVKTEENQYLSDHKYVISDFRLNRAKKPLNFSGYIYPDSYVYRLVYEDTNSGQAVDSPVCTAS